MENQVSVFQVTDDSVVVIQVSGIARTQTMGLKKSAAWKVYLALQSFFAAQPRNKRTGNTCPDCAEMGVNKVIDDRAERCRNHRVKKGGGTDGLEIA